MRVPRCKNFWHPGLFSTRHTAATHSIVGWGGWPANLVREMMPACYAITVSRHLRKALAPPEQHRTKEDSEKPGGSRPRSVGGPLVKIRMHGMALASLAIRNATTRMLADSRPATHNPSSTASHDFIVTAPKNHVAEHQDLQCGCTSSSWAGAALPQDSGGRAEDRGRRHSWIFDVLDTPNDFSLCKLREDRAHRGGPQSLALGPRCLRLFADSVRQSS